MKNPLIVALLALAVGAAGLVVLLVNRPASRPIDSVLPGSTGATGAPGPQADLFERMEELAEENRELRERLIELELRPAPEQRAPVSDALVSREEFDAFRIEILEALGASRRPLQAEGEEPTPTGLGEFREHVASALADIRKQEAAEKFPSLEQRTEAVDELMPKMEDWLELTPEQSDGMRSALLAQYEREADLLRRWQAGEDPEVLGAMKRTDREVHREDLAEVLTPEQLETYSSRLPIGRQVKVSARFERSTRLPAQE